MTKTQSPFPRYTGPVLFPTLYLRRPQRLPGLEFYQEHGRGMTRAEWFASIEDLAELHASRRAIERFAPACPQLEGQDLEAYLRRERELSR